MKLIDQIEQDAKKIKSQTTWSWGLAAIAICLGLFIGYGARDDYNEAFAAYNLVPSIAMAGLIFLGFGLTQNLKNRKWPQIGLVITLFVLLVSLLQKQTPISLLKFTDPQRYWIENRHCLYLGAIGGLLSSLVIDGVVLWAFPLPSKKMCVRVSGLNALCAVFLLSLHCPGPLRSHIVFAHWGAGLVVFALQYALNSFLLSFRSKQWLKQKK